MAILSISHACSTKTVSVRFLDYTFCVSAHVSCLFFRDRKSFSRFPERRGHHLRRRSYRGKLSHLVISMTLGPETHSRLSTRYSKFSSPIVAPYDGSDPATS